MKEALDVVVELSHGLNGGMVMGSQVVGDLNLTFHQIECLERFFDQNQAPLLDELGALSLLPLDQTCHGHLLAENDVLSHIDLTLREEDRSRLDALDERSAEQRVRRIRQCQRECRT